jgi:hypothetical protein
MMKSINEGKRRHTKESLKRMLVGCKDGSNQNPLTWLTLTGNVPIC